METCTGISKDYNCRFVLTEERLRKIISILKDFAKKNNLKTDLSFLLYTKSDIYLKTSNIDDVLNEENGGEKENYALILYFEKVITEKKKNMLVKIKFYKFKNQISLEVEATDRDQALILISDLEEQIDRMQERKTFYSIMSNRWSDLLVLTVISTIIILVLFKVLKSFEDKNYEKILSEIISLPLDEKLAKIYITNVYSVSALFPIILTILMIFMILYYDKAPISNLFKKLNNSFFVWNTEKEKYNKFIAMETNVKWVVIIGFIVSCLSSIAIGIIF